MSGCDAGVAARIRRAGMRCQLEPALATPHIFWCCPQFRASPSRPCHPGVRAGALRSLRAICTPCAADPWLRVLPRGPLDDARDHQQNKKDHEENLCDTCHRSGESREPEEPGDHGDYEKSDSPNKHICIGVPPAPIAKSAPLRDRVCNWFMVSFMRYNLAKQKIKSLHSSSANCTSLQVGKLSFLDFQDSP